MLSVKTANRLVTVALISHLFACADQRPPSDEVASDAGDDATAADSAVDVPTVDASDAALDPDATVDPAGSDLAPTEDVSSEPDVESVPDVPAGQSIVALTVGDIAKCSLLGYAGLIRDPHELTADLVANYPIDTPILTLGDHVYSDGSVLEFATCYSKGWGQYRDRTHPCPGNHDYNTDDAEGYYGYFETRAGHPDRGYYEFELGEWQALSLNSNCGDIPGDGCDAQSRQNAWLEDRLDASQSVCTLAYWHHPRWSSDRAGNSELMVPLMQALYDADADLVLVGHAHNYERFAPQTPDGQLDLERGIRQFVIGTGGADLRPLVDEKANSELFISEHGIVELTLHPDRYDWRFISIDGEVLDSGTQACH